MKVLLVIVALSSPAIAGRRCDEQSTVVGHQRCTRFGAGWSGATLSWEFGATALRVPLDAIARDTPTGHVTAAATTVVATAGRLRDLYGFGEHFYLASELTLGRLTPPNLTIDPVARETMPFTAQDRGWLFEGMLAAGTRSSVGPIVLGTELAFGTRLMIFSDHRIPAVLFGQGGPVLEARAHASVWLSMHWSAGLMLATSVVERDDISLTISLGLHAFPFDGGR